MNKKSFWCTLLAVVLAAAAAAVIAWLLYCYRDAVKAALSQAKEKGKKLLNSCRDEFSDFADL
jgi:2-methylcitrate dehydratase PrpD